MAADNFRQTLHKNCPKIIVILLYTSLEWILILLLLLNALFSYLIQNFTTYFGLKPFCAFCSRLDHVFDSKKHKSSHLDHICEAHMIEISKLAYCSNHRKLSESNNLCSNCPSTHPLFSWINRGGFEDSEQGEENRCSCCNGKFLKPTWDVLDYVQKKGSFVEIIDANQDLDHISPQSKSFSESDPTNEDDDNDNDHVWNSGDIDSDRFICIELIDTEPLPNSSEEVEDAEEEEEEDEGLDIHSGKHVEQEKSSLEKKGSRVEFSLDGSVTTDKEVDDENMTKEDKKSTVKSQQEALNALYAELEEERKAAAIAASETMAMITKLQEEKAAVKIEALQYQRMMEEQAEYDQEALQLLNDLIIKREKEKQELEKELEVYRSKVLGYETEEKLSKDSRFIDQNEFDDSDQECDYDDGLEGSGDWDTPDISLAEFDEERVSILQELKALEAKLFSLHDDDTQSSDDRKTDDCKAKKLLPLFDATENEFAEEDMDKSFIQEEMCHVYERLQALEADKEFLKHCISSMMKGNKGLSLLQEILQHLRDLKSVELSERKLVEIPLEEVSSHKED